MLGPVHISLLHGAVSIYSAEPQERIARRSAVILGLSSIEAFLNYIPEAYAFLAEIKDFDPSHDDVQFLRLMERCSFYNRVKAATHYITGSFCKDSPCILVNLKHAIGVRNAATHSKPSRLKEGESHYAVGGKRTEWINYLKSQNVIHENEYKWLSVNQLVESRIVVEWALRVVFDYFDHLISQTSPDNFLLGGFHPDPPDSGFINYYRLAKEEFDEKCKFKTDS